MKTAIKKENIKSTDTKQQAKVKKNNHANQMAEELERFVSLPEIFQEISDYYDMPGLVWDGERREMVPGNELKWQANDLMYQLTSACNKHLNNVETQLDKKRQEYLAARASANSSRGHDDAQRKLQYVKTTVNAQLHAQEFYDAMTNHFKKETGRTYRRYEATPAPTEATQDEAMLTALDREAAALGIKFVDKNVNLQTDGINTTEIDEVRISEDKDDKFDIAV